MNDLVKRLRIKAGMIEMGEMIAWGSDSALMREAADALEMAAPAVQGEPVAWKELAANWLREKAAAQQALNELYPEHAKCYPTWKNWVLKLNWLADELSAGATPQPAERQPAPDVADYEQVLDDHRRLTRELDVLLNGEEGAAQQASLADLVAQLRTVVRNTGKPVLAEQDVSGLVEALEASQHGLHDSIDGDECRCSQCKFVRLRDAALAAHRKGGDA